MREKKSSSRYDSPEYKAELKHKAKLRKIEERGIRKLRKRELKEKADSYKKPRKKIQTTKVITALLMGLMLINCLAIEAYSCYAMFILQDLSALYSLIGAVVTTTIGEVIAFSVYSAKSFSETKAEKQLEFEYAKLGSYTPENNNDNAVG